MSIGRPSILEQEDDLKGLPTQALQEMLRNPSGRTLSYLVAAELQYRKEQEAAQTGREAAAKTAQQPATVAASLAGMQQPIPMSQAGAMAAPPQQPPMPQEAQIAMALSGATGRPPPQLPTVNAERGTSGAAVAALVEAMRAKGTRTASQMPAHQPFASERRPPPVSNRGGLGALIAAIMKQQSEPERAYGGFDISEEVKLPRGRGGARAAARPVTAANGTQGRTVYAQTGWSDESPMGDANLLAALQGARRPPRLSPYPGEPFPYSVQAAAARLLPGQVARGRRQPSIDEIIAARKYAEDVGAYEYGPQKGPAADAVARWRTTGSALSPDGQESAVARWQARQETGGDVDDAITTSGTPFAPPPYHPVSGERQPAGADQIKLIKEATRNINERFPLSGESSPSQVSTTLQGEPRPTLPPYHSEYDMPDAEGAAARLLPRQVAQERRPPALPRIPSLEAGDPRSEFMRDWDRKIEKGAVETAASQGVTARDSVLSKFESEIGRPGSVLGYFRNTPAEREKGNILAAKFRELRPQLERDAALFARFAEDPRAFLEAALVADKPPEKVVDGPPGEPIEKVVEALGQPTPSATKEVSPVIPGYTGVDQKSASTITLKGVPVDGAAAIGVDRESIQSQILNILGGVTTGPAEKVDVTAVAEKARVAGDVMRESLGKETTSLIETQHKALDKIAAADKASLKKIDESFTALKDFQETGRLPQKHRDALINAGLMEFGAALLDPNNPDLYGAFSAGLKGFKEVEKGKRKEYLEGLKFAVTTETAQQKLSMERRDAEGVARRSLAQFQIAQRSRDEAAAAAAEKRYTDATNDARRFEIMERTAATGKLSALAAMLNAIKPDKDARMFNMLLKGKLEEAQALAEQGDVKLLNEAFIYDEKTHQATPKMGYFVDLWIKMSGADLRSLLSFRADFRGEASAARSVADSVEKKVTNLLLDWNKNPAVWKEVWGKNPTPDELQDPKILAEIQRKAKDWAQRNTPGHPRHPRYKKATGGQGGDDSLNPLNL
jgi:hypothetical protein